jgi:hypothetical protein
MGLGKASGGTRAFVYVVVGLIAAGAIWAFMAVTVLR